MRGISRALSTALVCQILFGLNATATAEIHWSAFFQVTGEVLGRPHEDGLEFGFDRARVGFDWHEARWFGKLQLELNVNNAHETPDAGLPNIVKHAFVGYRISDQLKLRLGQTNGPVGMDFNRPGANLDITKRGLEKPLTFEFFPGLTLIGDNYGPLGFDIGVYRVASRSAAVAADPAANVGGDALAYAARIRLDRTPGLHWEASWGISEEAGGTGTRDYRVWNAGGWWQHKRWTLRSEVIRGENLLGIADTRERAGYLHVGYALQPTLELVARHYKTEHTANAVDTELDNTYVGVTLRRKPGSQHNRLQFNYVFAGGDEAGYRGLNREYVDDALLMQWQLQFK